MTRCRSVLILGCCAYAGALLARRGARGAKAFATVSRQECVLERQGGYPHGDGVTGRAAANARLDAAGYRGPDLNATWRRD